MTRRLRVGLVGTGWVAHQHMAGYRFAAGDVLEVTAACDPRADVLQDFTHTHGIAHGFSTAGELISSGEVDAIVLLTPPAVRDEVIDPAMERGLSILVEKPFAADGASSMRFVRNAESAGVTLAVSQNFRWFPEYRWLHDRLRAPDAGAIEYLEARSFQDRPQSRGQWRASETKLEMAIFGVHLIDRMQWLARGVPETVSALTRRGADQSIAGEQFTSLTVAFEGGVVGRMTSSWKSRALPVQDARIDTTTGSAVVRRLHPMSGEAQADSSFEGAIDSVSFADDAAVPQMAQSYGLSGREFALAVLEEREPEHSGRDNLKTMGIMEAAYLSAARGGEPVSVAEALAEA